MLLAASRSRFNIRWSGLTMVRTLKSDGIVEDVVESQSAIELFSNSVLCKQVRVRPVANAGLCASSKVLNFLLHQDILEFIQSKNGWFHGFQCIRFNVHRGICNDCFCGKLCCTHSYQRKVSGLIFLLQRKVAVSVSFFGRDTPK